jgi:hypothetical protein
MPDLGERANVMGPQPIMRRKSAPPAMLATADHVLDLLAAGKRAELVALAMPQAASDVAEIAAAKRPDAYDHHEIIATARVKNHHFVKARLLGPRGDQFAMIFRLGEYDGRWMIWDVVNLTGLRGALTR